MNQPSTPGNPNRQPKGIPTGGQFAASALGESGVSLGAAPEPHQAEHETFDITVRGIYSRMEIPPRHRKPRPVHYETETVVRIPSVTSDQAPVAIEVHAGTQHPEDQVRVFNGDLYEPYKPHSGQTEPTIAGSDQFPNMRDKTARSFATPDGHSPEEFAALAEASYRNHLVVDGEVWTRCGEPRYVVQTFGLGYNHGGTGLFTDSHDNSNVPAENYFRADEFEAARAFAIQTAEDRGDTDAAASLRKATPLITVHDPAALRLVPVKRESPEVVEARAAYSSAAHAYASLTRFDHPTAEDEAAAWQRMVEAREALLAMTTDVTGFEAQKRPYEDGRDSIW